MYDLKYNRIILGKNMKKFRLIITSFVLLVAIFYLSSCDKVEDEVLDQNFVIDTETREVNFG